MNFGGHLPIFGPVATRENLLAFARRAEALGYDSLSREVRPALTA